MSLKALLVGLAAWCFCTAHAAPLSQAFDDDYNGQRLSQVMTDIRVDPAVKGHMHAPSTEHVSPVKIEDAVALPADEASDDEVAIETNFVQSDKETIPQDIRRTLHEVSPSPIPEHLTREIMMPKKHALSEDGRPDMVAKKSDPLDEDCDSPQLGESEPWPAEGVEIKMDGEKGGTMAEQGAHREVLPDHGSFVQSRADDPAAHHGKPNQHPSEFEKPIEFDDNYRTESLPPPNVEAAKKSKCSRFLNGHDAPDAMQILDDDCGMPEPEIPCETVGNSTLCVPRMQLKIPPVPMAELMPPIPAPAYEGKSVDGSANISVEFVDFGLTKEVHTHIGNTVGRVIEEAGAEFAVDAWASQLIRNAGVDVKANVLVNDLTDRQQIVVYLTCTYRRFLNKLIMPIPACEDLVVHRFVARVEIPAFDAVYEVNVLSTERVGSALSRTPVDVERMEKITYDGRNVTLETPLEQLYFRNGSAFVVYPKEPCPSHTPSPSNTPSPHPSFSPTPSMSITPSASPSPDSKRKGRKFGAYDAYRHCRNSKGEKVRPPDPDALGLDSSVVDPDNKANDDDFECEGSEMTIVEEPDYSGVGGTREEADVPEIVHGRVPMTEPVKIQVDFEGRRFPVLIKPIAKGIDIFDAVRLTTGFNHNHMVAEFEQRPIDHFTPLKPFGFVEGDVVFVKHPTRPAKKAAVAAKK